MEQQRPRRRCSLVRVLIGVVVFALVVFVATHGMLQSLHAAQDELTHLERFGHDLLYRGHFVREPTDGVEVLCDDGGCRSVPQPELPVEVIDKATDDASRPGTREDVPRV